MRFLQNTVLAGLVFFVPVVVIVLVVVEAGEFMLLVAEPLAGFVPVDTIGGIALANVIAGIIVLTLCFLGGLMARLERIRRLVESAEYALLSRIPGYSLMKEMTNALTPDSKAHMKPVLVTRGASSRIGLEVERTQDHRVAVYLPGSPNAWAGVVEVFDAEQVTVLDAPIDAVFAHTQTLGRGVRDLLG